MEEEFSASAAPQPQLTDMFQKFALAFKTKTYEFFADEHNYASIEDGDGEADVSLLLDSSEELIPDQKVVVIRPDSSSRSSGQTHLYPNLIHTVFSLVSSFEASYVQLQAAHVPEVDQNAMESADQLIVSNLQKLTELKGLYRKGRLGLGVEELGTGSVFEFQVQENQNKLRALETVVNYLQSMIDAKDEEVRALRKKRDKIRGLNYDLSRRLGDVDDCGLGVLLTVRVFEAILGDSIRSSKRFTKLLICLMRKAGWDVEEASSHIHSGVDYQKKGHYKYAFLSYVCLGMFQGFDKGDFELGGEENSILDGTENGYLNDLVEHVACNPMEILSKDMKCKFSRFCEKKYQELIHPTMESSIFSNLDRKEKVLDSWKSLRVFYESFVRMASSVWLFHKLAYMFDPIVEIFRVGKGAEFSVVYMEDVLGKRSSSGKMRPIVEFTVIPGFKVSGTVVQAQVYTRGSESGRECESVRKLKDNGL